MIWIAVSADEYELPYAVAESARELADMLCTTLRNIKAKKSMGTSGRNCGYRVVTVDIMEEEQMKYSILESFQDYLEETMNKNTARKYYSAVKNLFKEIAFEGLEEIEPEYVKERMRRIPTKNEFSAAKRGLMKLQEFDPGLKLPEEEFFRETAKTKRNRVKSRGQKIYKDMVIRKIDRVKDPDLRLAYRLAMVSGLRVSELADLKPGDVKVADDGHIQVSVRNGKGGKSGLVDCLDDAYVKARLEQLLKKADPETALFYSPGYMMNEASRLGFECHDLRRIYAQDLMCSKLLEGKTKAEAVDEVREGLRHSRPETTQIYLQGRTVIRGHPE